ncbi:hypothetical protein [Hyalangium versicolor]|uniref:hypothetical protein n=1 Tax=Hyalangium versicolor TaxID=2861190 RepID=UPI001CCD57DB|nr:hypothetical protein [Hyalangium versicolor]
MRRLGSALLAASVLAGCGGVESAPSSESLESPALERQQAPLTTTDVDVAPECQGILTFVNTVPYATLDAYLPSDLANVLVAQRATTPFVTLAQLDAVAGVGPARLDSITTGARANGFIGSNCVGILDELAISSDDSAAIASLVNTISDSELHDVLPDAWNGAVNLLNLRPFTSAKAISEVSGIGHASLRNIRNSATLSRPFEALVAAVNAAPQPGNSGASLARHFDWWEVVMTADYGGRGSLECFGLEPSSVPHDATVRDNLADAAEVREAVANTVNVANYYHQISDPLIKAGKDNLAALTENRKFKGCKRTYEPDPWSSHTIAIFVDIENGFSVMTHTYWAE